MRLLRLLFLVVTVPLTLATLPPVAFAADARCGNTLIASPSAHDSVSGIITISGRAQLEGAFVRYQVDYSAKGLNLWVLLNSAPQAVMDGTLAHWDTTTVPEGAYDLRVRSIDTSGNYCETIVSPVYVKQNAVNPVTSADLIPLPVGQAIEISTAAGNLTVQVPQVPSLAYCTPAAYVGSVVTHSIRLCAGQIYRPFTVIGNNIALIGDVVPSSGQPSSPAIIRSGGRTFGITVRGSNVLISGVHTAGTTASADSGNWLCLYEQCAFANPPINGGEAYGGGIFLAEGSNNTVLNSVMNGGVIGIAATDGQENQFIGNEIAGLSGWGIFARGVTNSVFLGNTLHDINRACTAPSGQFFAAGCESAGMLLMGADTNLIANNTYARSGNCYYLNGEGGKSNNFNKLYGNSCTAPSFNCFEITDAQGIEFDGNIAALTPDDTAGCDLWLVRAQILAGRNNRINPCNHRGSHLDSTYDPPKP